MAAVRTIICGSPRLEGNSHAVAGYLADALRLRFPADELRFFSVAQGGVNACMGCNSCERTGRCWRSDMMGQVIAALDDSTEVFVVSPVYFSGPPSQLKALFDRFQPLYYRMLKQSEEMRTNASCPSDSGFDKEQTMIEKRPVYLLAVGDGGDPHGFSPLEGTCRSAFGVAGYSLRQTLPLIAVDYEDACIRVDKLLEDLGESDRCARIQ